MLGTKGVLKVTLLVVGVLVVGLGMYGAFLPQQTEAGCSATGRVHDAYDWNTGETKTPTGDTEIWTTNCSRCPNYPASDHTAIEYKHASNGVFIYKHRWFWDSDWTHCHTHTYSISFTLWDVVPCNQSGGGG